MALGHAISHCIKFPITLPILRPWEQLDGPIQWPSSSGQFAWSTTNRAARTEPAPPSTSPPPPPSSCASPRGVWAGGGGLGIPQVLLGISSLPLPSRFWNPSRLLAATQPTWQERSEFDERMDKEEPFFVHFVFSFDASSSLHSVIAIHLFCIIFSCILSPSFLNQLLSKLTKSSLVNHSLNETIFTVSVITLLVPLWTFLLLLYAFRDAGKQNCANYCDVLHLKFFLQHDLSFKGFQLPEAGLLNYKVFLHYWLRL